jgi:hypothetical protein
VAHCGRSADHQTQIGQIDQPIDGFEMVGYLSKPHNAGPRQVTTFSAMWQVGLSHDGFDHAVRVFDQFFGSTQCGADRRAGRGLAMAASLRGAEHVQEPSVHLE